MTKIVIVTVLTIIWLYLLHVLKKAKLSFWRFIIGSAGLFIFLMVAVMPFATTPLSQVVAGITGLFGKLFGFFTAYYKYSVIFVESGADTLTLTIDFECSGIIEIFAFLCLLVFFNVYSIQERWIVGLAGTAYIVFANVIRVTAICVIIHFFGVGSYYIAHTYIGRIIFYTLSVALYFIVFTKSQIVRQKVGGFRYDRD
ncbi:MAG: exosortase family protein XrtG [Lachnospiraceae bacterium]|nr:exosortase family protein XrtG [Lachnospiraceae bacterium]